MRNFFVEFELCSPIVITERPSTLDAVLAGELFARYGDPDRALREVPIARTDHGIPQASVMLFGKPAGPTMTPVYVRKSIGRSLQLDKRPPVPGFPPRLDAGRGALQNESNTYLTADVSRVWFLARGDIARARALLSGLSFIGKGHRRGFGEIASRRVAPLDDGETLFGIVGGPHLLRPFPQRLKHVLPDALRDGPVEERTWENPYWPPHGGTVEPCLVPNFMFGEGVDTATLAVMSGLSEPA